MIEKRELFSIKKGVKCIECGNMGAIQSYGSYYPFGMGEEVSPYYEKYKKTSFLRRTESLGGTIPYECLFCENKGYIDSDFGGYEGYKKAFYSIK